MLSADPAIFTCKTLKISTARLFSFVKLESQTQRVQSATFIDWHFMVPTRTKDTRQWPEASDFIAPEHVFAHCVSQKTHGHVRIAAKHTFFFFDWCNMQKCVAQIIYQYLGPLPKGHTSESVSQGLGNHDNVMHHAQYQVSLTQWGILDIILFQAAEQQLMVAII